MNPTLIPNGSRIKSDILEFKPSKHQKCEIKEYLNQGKNKLFVTYKAWNLDSHTNTVGVVNGVWKPKIKLSTSKHLQANVSPSQQWMRNSRENFLVNSIPEKRTLVGKWMFPCTLHASTMCLHSFCDVERIGRYKMSWGYKITGVRLYLSTMDGNIQIR